LMLPLPQNIHLVSNFRAKHQKINNCLKYNVYPASAPFEAGNRDRHNDK
jgi:hypothetical protein